MSDKTVKIELELTAEEYQRLVEFHFAGSLVLDQLYWNPQKPDPEPNFRLATKLHLHASKFGREDLVFTHPDLDGHYAVSKSLEERLTPYIFADE